MSPRAPKAERPVVAVILVTWNQKDDALECLGSLANSTWRPLEIVLVDNGSTDGTPEAVARDYPCVRVIRAGSNLGFPGANNLGIRCALDSGSRFLFLLNTDTVVAPDCIDRLVEAMNKEPRLGIAAPKMYFYHDPRRIWFAGGSTDPDTGFSRHWGYGQLDEAEDPGGEGMIPCTFVTGAGMFVRREVFLQVGLLDEDFFHTAEDNDVCIRALRAGFLLACIPRASLRHKVMSTTGGTQRTSPVYAYYEYRNKLYLVKKHSRGRAWFKKTPFIVYNMVKAEARVLVKEKNPAAASAILEGIVDFFRGATGRRRFSHA
jgi:GT2 family glycosyltransferase